MESAQNNEKKYVGAVFFDYDGTLVDEQEKMYEMSAVTRRDIEVLKSKGYLTALATGRPKCYIPDNMPFDCFVTTNGSYAEVDSKTVFHQTVEPDSLKRLLTFFEEHDINYLLETQDNAYCYKWDKYFEHFVNTFNISTKRIFTIDKMPENCPISKLNIIYAEPEMIKRVDELFGNEFEFMLHRGSTISCDISVRGISKATGVKAVIDYFGIDTENTYAFGDNDNDAEMLKVVGHGIVMEKHSRLAEECAEYITKSVVQEGIHHALVHYGLVSDNVPSPLDMVKLKGVCKDYIWGSTRLKTDFGKVSDSEKIAESWELSAHRDGLSTVVGGEYDGKTLTEYIDMCSKKCGRSILGTNCERFEMFPVLIKLIDSADKLSVQVHPDDKYALEHEGEYGKTEMWYVIDCEKDAFLYFGVKEPVSKELLKEKIDNGTVEELLNRVPVKKGDSFFIQSGTLHAIGAGILICEVQQNSNTTYRVYDYKRKDKNGKERELHVDKALKVASLEPSQNKKPYRISNTAVRLSECDYFTADVYSSNDECTISVDESSFVSIVVTDGQAQLSLNNQKLSVKKGDSVFIPAQNGDIKALGKFEAIVTRV